MEWLFDFFLEEGRLDWTGLGHCHEKRRERERPLADAIYRPYMSEKF